MSFGYSVGDFVTAATLAWKLSIAIRSAKGAPESYRDLIQELELTAQTLFTAGQLLETAGIPASSANCIALGLSKCRNNLLRLRIIVKNYQECMETPNPQGGDWYGRFAVRAGLKKMLWELSEKEGITEIRQNIKNGITEITLILEACGL